MAEQFLPDFNASFESKVVVITGGAAGIGAALVRLLHAAGAHVVFGDVLSSEGSALASVLRDRGGQGTCTFVTCNAASYSDTLALFDAALRAHGHIDHAVAVAGIVERAGFIGPELDMESVRKEPHGPLELVDVNLKGPLHMARLASVYLRQGEGVDTDEASQVDRSLTLVSSVAAFREDPGLVVYTATKHGVMGLMRSLRNTLPLLPGPRIRTNTICPWMTRTRMVTGFEEQWDKNDLPANTPEDIARHIMGVMADPGLNGEAIYIEGARGWKFESRQRELMPQWLGERQVNDLDKGSRVLASGDGWTKGQKPS